MYDRLATSRLLHLARQFPAVLILGARQVGKTTLARQAFASHTYLDLEDPSTRALSVSYTHLTLPTNREV